MRILITGAGGFVGRYLTRHLLQCRDEVLATDLRADNSAPECPVQELDVCSPDDVTRVLSGFKPDVVFHLAGMTFVPDAEGNFEGALKANVLGTNSIFRMAYLLERPCTIVFISSAEVYGKVDPKDLPITEETPVTPTNNYSLSKAFAELVANRYGRAKSPRCLIMRPFNHIGPGQSPRFVASAFASQLARIAKGKAPPAVKVGNLEAQRDFSDVRDIVRAYRMAAERGSGIYNLCSGKPVAISSILDQLIAVSGLNVQVVQDPERMRGPEVPVLYGSFEKAGRELGWTPEYALQDTLRDLYKYWLEREE